MTAFRREGSRAAIHTRRTVTERNVPKRSYHPCPVCGKAWYRKINDAKKHCSVPKEEGR